MFTFDNKFDALFHRSHRTKHIYKSSSIPKRIFSNKHSFVFGKRMHLAFHCAVASTWDRTMARESVTVKRRVKYVIKIHMQHSIDRWNETCCLCERCDVWLTMMMDTHHRILIDFVIIIFLWQRMNSTKRRNMNSFSYLLHRFAIHTKSSRRIIIINWSIVAFANVFLLLVVQIFDLSTRHVPPEEFFGKYEKKWSSRTIKMKSLSLSLFLSFREIQFTVDSENNYFIFICIILI